MVTNGKSCYNESLGLKINGNELLASFFSRVYPRPLNAELKVKDSKSGGATSLVIGQDTVDQLFVQFKRTLRMPVDGKAHSLPPGLGSFPLFNVEDYSDRLPPAIAALGGIFFPMYRR